MAIIRNRADLILASALHDNPTLPLTLNYNNCYVYTYGSYSSSKGTCIIKGRAGLGIRGKVRVKYTKLDIAVMLKNLQPRVNVANPVTSIDLIPAVNAKYGFDLKASEVVSRPVEPDGRSVIFEIAKSATVYRGSILLVIGPAPVDLSSIVVNRELEIDVAYWPATPTVQGALLSVGHDYTLIGQSLSGFVTGVLSASDATNLVTLLKSVDKLPWTAVKPADYSLADANVLYNGKVSLAPSELASVLRKDYTHVLVLRPDIAASANMAQSPVMFYYNVFI